MSINLGMDNQRKSSTERRRTFSSNLRDLGDNDPASELDSATFYFVKGPKITTHLSLGISR